VTPDGAQHASRSGRRRERNAASRLPKCLLNAIGFLDGRPLRVFKQPLAIGS
jgi:hypothetical protein